MAISFTWLNPDYRIAIIEYAGQVTLQQLRNFYRELSMQRVMPRFVLFETVNFIISPELANFDADRKLTLVDMLIQEYFMDDHIEAILILQPNRHPFFGALLRYADLIGVRHKVELCRSQADALEFIHAYLQQQANSLDETQPSNTAVRAVVAAASNKLPDTPS